MTLTLDQFARQQLEAQGLSVREFARRSGLGLSHAYQVLRGERPHSSVGTVEAVAKGLNMTPAELLMAMGKGTGELAPDEAEFLAIFRQVPGEQRLAAKSMLRGLAVEPVQRRANTRTDRSAKRHQEALRKELGDQRDQGNSPPDGPLVIKYPQVHTLVRFLLSPFQQPLATAPAG